MRMSSSAVAPVGVKRRLDNLPYAGKIYRKAVFLSTLNLLQSHHCSERTLLATNHVGSIMGCSQREGSLLAERNVLDYYRP